MKQQQVLVFARKLRKQQTDAEKLLWFHLRNRQVEGMKFRRQFPIGSYIVDFACTDKYIIVELDGSQHAKDNIKRYDQQRTKYLESIGYVVLRFWDNDVLTNVTSVLEVIRSTLSTSP